MSENATESSSGPQDFATRYAQMQQEPNAAPPVAQENNPVEQAPQIPAEQVTPSARPAYADQLERVPEGMRPLVEPIFKEWDSGVTQRFQKIRDEEYGWVKPYEGLKEMDPEYVDSALQYATAVQENPLAVYRAMEQALRTNGLLQEGTQTPEQQTDQPPTDNGIWDDVDPRLKGVFDQQQEQLQQQGELLQMLGQNYLGAQEQQQYAEAEQEIEAELAAAKAKAPLWDEEYVISQMNLTGCSADEAANRLVERFGNQFAPKGTPVARTAPVVMGASGSIPTTQINTTQMSEADRKSLLAASLQAAVNQAQG